MEIKEIEARIDDIVDAVINHRYGCYVAHLELCSVFYDLIKFALEKDGFECNQGEITPVEVGRFFNDERRYVLDNLRNQLIAYFCSSTDYEEGNIAYGVQLMKCLYANIKSHFFDDNEDVLRYMTIAEIVNNMNIEDTVSVKCKAIDTIYRDLVCTYSGVIDDLHKGIIDNEEVFCGSKVVFCESFMCCITLRVKNNENVIGLYRIE